MNKPQYSTLVESALHHVHHAQALIAYAAVDADFAQSLAHYVQEQQWQCVSLPADPASRYAVPSDQHDAIRVTHWLMQELDEQPEAYTARGVLATWASTYKHPQNIVLGIVGLAVIGPTLGLIENKKKKKKKMQLVVDADWAKQFTQEEFVSKTHNLSQAVVAKELRAARGKLECLHPDTADWCMGGSETKLQLVDQADIQTVYDTLAVEQLSHIALCDKDSIVAIGVSPCISDELVEDIVS